MMIRHCRRKRILLRPDGRTLWYDAKVVAGHDVVDGFPPTLLLERIRIASGQAR